MLRALQVVFVVTAGFVEFIAVGERPSQRGLEQSISPEVDTEEPAESVQEDLKAIKNFYNPENGTMAQWLDGAEKLQAKTNRSAKTWTQKSYEAMKAANRVMVASTKGAANVLMSDGMRLSQALKGDFYNEMGKMDPIDVNATARQRIREELFPPHEHPHHMRGMKVLCNWNYKGASAEHVHGASGVVEDYIPSETRWKIRLDGHPELMPHLAVNEFEILPTDELDAYGLHGGSQSRSLGRQLLGEERAMAMAPYMDHQVRIDHLPTSMDPELYMHKIGTVHDYDRERKLFRIQIPGMEEERWPWLAAGVNFHKLAALRGQVVEVNTGVVDPLAANVHDTKGIVKDWHAGDAQHPGYYTVVIPKHTVPNFEVQVAPDKLKRLRFEWEGLPGRQLGLSLDRDAHAQLRGRHGRDLLNSRVRFLDPSKPGEHAFLTGMVTAYSPQKDDAGPDEYRYTVRGDNGVVHTQLTQSDLRVMTSYLNHVKQASELPESPSFSEELEKIKQGKS